MTQLASCPVAVSGEICLAAVPQLRAGLTGCVAHGCTGATLDAGGLRFIDARGLSVLAHVTKLEARGGGLIVERVPPTVQKAMAVGGLAPVIGVGDQRSAPRP